jgi:hypothetical protein
MTVTTSGSDDKKLCILYTQISQKTEYFPKYNEPIYCWIGGGARGGAVVKALRYKPEDRGIDSRCQNFSLT